MRFLNGFNRTQAFDDLAPSCDFLSPALPGFFSPLFQLVPCGFTKLHRVFLHYQLSLKWQVTIYKHMKNKINNLFMHVKILMPNGLLLRYRRKG